MTNKQLALWLTEKPNREYKVGNYVDASVRRDYLYHLNQEDEEVPNDIYIREGDEPWHVPLTEE